MADLSNNIRYPIVLDICQEKYESIDIMQGNKDSISLDIYINDNGNPVTLPAISDSIKYCLESSRSDSEQSPIEKEASNVDGNVVTFDCIDEYILSYPGQIYCIISIYNSSSGKVHKLPYGFYINIIDSPFNEDGVVHSDEFSVLSKLIIDSMDLKEQVEEIFDEAEVLLPQMEEAVSNENIRKEAEVIRTSNENERIAAEALRETNTSTAIANCNNAKDLAIEKANLANDASSNANAATEACNNATNDCKTATENSTTATTNAINSTNQCISVTDNCESITINCVDTIGICEDKTEECVNATNDCEEITNLVQMKLLNGDFKGDPGVITTIEGQVAFQIEHGDLILYYTGDEAPNYSINENGCLIFTF